MVNKHFVKFGFHYLTIADAVALQDGLSTFTNALIHAESHMRKTIAEHVQVFMDVLHLPDHSFNITSV